jgi:hypothetical protein
MKKLITYIFMLILGTLLYARTAEPTPPNHSGVIWHTITVIDYKPGTVEAAKGVIRKFEAASESAGTASPVIYWFESGKYDMVVTWKLKDEPADHEQGWSHDDVEWWNALVEQEGSLEAATQLHSDYLELIATSITNVARKAK